MFKKITFAKVHFKMYRGTLVIAVIQPCKELHSLAVCALPVVSVKPGVTICTSGRRSSCSFVSLSLTVLESLVVFSKAKEHSILSRSMLKLASGVSVLTAAFFSTVPAVDFRFEFTRFQDSRDAIIRLCQPFSVFHVMPFEFGARFCSF